MGIWVRLFFKMHPLSVRASTEGRKSFSALPVFYMRLSVRYHFPNEWCNYYPNYALFQFSAFLKPSCPKRREMSKGEPFPKKTHLSSSN